MTKGIFLKVFIIMNFFVIIGNATFCHATTSVASTQDKKEPKPTENQWKYNDNDSKAIRDYDAKKEKWYSTTQAILRCQRLAFKSYEIKIRALLDKKKYDIYEDAEKLKSLDNTKNHAFSICSKAFETTSTIAKTDISPDSPPAQTQQKEWKNNDPTSIEIRQYDKRQNNWTTKNQAIERCKQKAQSNYQARKISVLDRQDFDPQADAQILEDLKAFKSDTFSACERAFEK